MFFLLRPHRDSVLGRVLSGIRSALLVGLGLLAVPYLSEGGPEPPRFASLEADAASLSRGGEAWGGIRPVSRSEGAQLTGKRLSGPVTHVRDGDTIEIAGVPVRIANLDCAEKGSAAGSLATRRMYNLALHSDLSCRLTGRRSYDREVGTCRLPDGRDIGAVLVSEGLCAGN